MRTRTTERRAKAAAVVAPANSPVTSLPSPAELLEEVVPANLLRGLQLEDASRADSVRDVSGELADRTNHKPEPAGAVQRRVSNVSMTGFESIIDNVFAFDPDVAYEQVTACLQLGQKPSQTDYGSLVNALDAGEENARVALQLLANARVALARYTADVRVIQGRLREQSVAELKASGAARPTIADIEAYMMAEYHDEWRDGEVQVSTAKETVHYLEGLASLVAQRARDLRQMVASARGA